MTGGGHPSLGGRRVLVTGGAGFIGSHVVPALVAAGADVTVADLLPYRHEAVRSIVVDLNDEGAFEQALQPGCDSVVHLAALTSVLRSVERPVETFRTNVAMTAALLERCRQIEVGSVVFASTNAVVGAVPPGLISEVTPMRPLTPYGATKAAAEMLLCASTATDGVRGTSLRFTNVYGPGMVLKDSVVARIMRAAESGSTFDIYGDGLQVRDYVFIDDVVDAVMLALATPMSGPVVIGSGVSTSVVDLLDLSRAATGAAIPARHVAPKPGEMARVEVDIALAGAAGWTPSVPLPEGLSRVWATWGQHSHTTRAGAA